MRKPDPVDVLVIGAGASGAVSSLVLAQAGLRVVCLDRAAGPSRRSIRTTATTSNISARTAGVRSRASAAGRTITRSRASSPTR